LARSTLSGLERILSAAESPSVIMDFTNLRLSGLLAAIVSPGTLESTLGWTSSALAEPSAAALHEDQSAAAEAADNATSEPSEPPPTATKALLGRASRPRSILKHTTTPQFAKLVLSLEQIKAVATYAQSDSEMPRSLPPGLQAAIHKVRECTAPCNAGQTVVALSTWPGCSSQQRLRGLDARPNSHLTLDMNNAPACADGVDGDLHQSLGPRHGNRSRECSRDHEAEITRLSAEPSSRDHDTVCRILKDQVRPAGPSLLLRLFYYNSYWKKPCVETRNI